MFVAHGFWLGALPLPAPLAPPRWPTKTPPCAMAKLNAQQFIVCKCSENCKTFCHLPLLAAAATAHRQLAARNVAL